jgi:hypothetical protein
MRGSIWPRLCGVLWLCLAQGPGLATATPAGDKATAREAATEGIERFRAGDYAGALDRLQRAQTLYQAPVHLLYIARCQRKLGKWVEAAETYRALSHQQLPSNAPQAFINAKLEGEQELAALEPKIPKLVISIEPPEARIDVLRIDWQEVSPAVVGIERPTNPGQHVVQAEAEGYGGVEQHLDISESETQKLHLKLTEQAPSPLAKAPEPSLASPPSKPKGKPNAGGGRQNASDEPRASLIAGLRLGGAYPGGKLPARVLLPAAAENAQVSLDQVGTGGADVELQLGARFPTPIGIIRNAGLQLFLQLNPLRVRDRDPFENLDLGQDASLARPNLASVGLAVTASGRPDRFSGFGELGLIFVRSLSFKLNLDGSCADGGSPQVSVTASGPGLRAAGGVSIPISGWLRLLPYVAFNASTITSVEHTANPCAVEVLEDTRYGAFDDGTVTREISGGPVNNMLSVGLGGEFAYALD